jgi:hypothetical protein
MARAMLHPGMSVLQQLARGHALSADRVAGGHIAFFPGGGGTAFFADAVAGPFTTEVPGTHKAFTLPSLVEFFLVEFHRRDIRALLKARQQKFVRTIHKNS